MHELRPLNYLAFEWVFIDLKIQWRKGLLVNYGGG